MDKYQEALLVSIDTLINEKLKKIQFNRCVDGVVTAVNSGIYTVIINGESYNIPALNGTYVINDLVFILVKNNNDSEKYILCKRP